MKNGKEKGRSCEFITEAKKEAGCSFLLFERDKILLPCGRGREKLKGFAGSATIKERNRRKNPRILGRTLRSVLGRALVPSTVGEKKGGGKGAGDHLHVVVPYHGER